MTFTSKSGLVRIWGRRVLSGQNKLEDVPKLYNLPNAVKTYIEEQGGSAE